MPYIRVINAPGKFDYVSEDLLDSLIKLDGITHFFRPSESRWINIRIDPVRRRGGCYQGLDRRKTYVKLQD